MRIRSSKIKRIYLTAADKPDRTINYSKLSWCVRGHYLHVAIFVHEYTIRYKNGIVFLQYIHQVLRHLKIPIGGLILRRRLHIITLQFLRDASPHMDDVAFNISPPQRVDLALSHPGVERYRKEHIIPSVLVLLRLRYEPVVLLRRVVMQFSSGFSKFGSRNVPTPESGFFGISSIRTA